MYIILVYDVGQKRCGKMLKLCRRYLHWIQNSVFEGELTPLQLDKLIKKAEGIMDKNHDSLIIFTSQEERWLEKQVIGVERQPISQFW